MRRSPLGDARRDAGVKPKLFFWQGGVVGAIVSKAADDAAIAGAERILKRANERVPYLTGRLEDSGQVSGEGGRASISYHTAYAARLHQHPEYNFRGKGRGKWLWLAIQEDKDETMYVMAQPFRNALGQFSVRPRRL
jgi:hypothetical protein